MDRVRLKGTSQFGTIVEVEKDFNKVKWQGTRAMFICVEWDSGGQHYYAPGQLRRKGSR